MSVPSFSQAEALLWLNFMRCFHSPTAQYLETHSSGGGDGGEGGEGGGGLGGLPRNIFKHTLIFYTNTLKEHASHKCFAMANANCPVEHLRSLTVENYS